ncbi:N-acetylmuramoyl-L-alanine amidase [Anaeroselena agilis]|uniref:N-acetylmuramoyl-L-alanine amidase n=1 Tax=Anaeroselena agilis TaxID=3063788 RepID=A0ABU3NZE2_9FIRM|nr:N-acetylmuramoyl-L-alanine amidase [Selenomonadales bacterium 4137-cl]
MFSRIVFVNAGHDGAVDPGALGAMSTEAGLMMLFAEELQAALIARAYQVLMSRSGPDASNYDLAYVCELANNSGAGLFISLHANSFASPSAHGFEVWTSPGPTKADLFADLIVRNVQAFAPELTIRADKSDGDDDKEGNLYVLTHTLMPAVLIEIAFISNPQEEMWMNDPTFRARVIEAICAAVDQFAGF